VADPASNPPPGNTKTGRGTRILKDKLATHRNFSQKARKIMKTHDFYGFLRGEKQR
jgi:hypothetical protein